MDSEVLTKIFNDAISRIQDSDAPTSKDFTTLANIKLMLYFNRKLMPRKSYKIGELKW